MYSPVSSRTFSPPPGNAGETLATIQKRGWRFLAAFGCLCVINLVVALDATILSVAIPTIANDLHGNAVQAFWAGTSFLLTSTAFQPSWASFSHIFGRKPMILSALTLFTAGTIISGAATDFTHLLIGRSIQGVGGGGIIALTYVVVTDLVSVRERGKWFGLISLVWALGTVSGPIIGGALAQHASWRWIFWINLPFCGLGFIVVPIFLRLRYKAGSFVEKLQQVDWPGTVLFVGSLTSLLIPISWGGSMYDWSSWRTLVPLMIGIVGLAIFILYTKYLRLDRNLDCLIRPSLFESKIASASFLNTVIHGTILWSLLYYMPLYFEAAKHLSPTSTGVAMLPQNMSVAPSTVVIGLLITKTGKYTSFVWSGWIMVTLGLGLQVLLKESTTTVAWVFILIVAGLGCGILYSAQSFSIQASASDKDLPFSAAMYSFFRAAGQMLGVAIGGTVFQNTMLHKLRAYPDLAPHALQISRDAAALVQVLNDYPPSEAAVRQQLIQAYVDSLRVVWIVMCALGAVGLAVSLLWVRDVSLDRVLETDQGFVYDNKNIGGESESDLEIGQQTRPPSLPPLPTQAPLSLSSLSLPSSITLSSPQSSISPRSEEKELNGSNQTPRVKRERNPFRRWKNELYEGLEWVCKA